MSFPDLCRVLGKYLLYFSLALCLPLGVAIYYQYIASPEIHPQPHSTWAFFLTILICLCLSFLLSYKGKKAKGILYRKESILLLVFIWILTSLISACPFYLTNTLKNPLDAYFEALSGITTTGCTLLTAKKFDPHTHQEIPIVVESPHVPGKTYSYFGTIDPIYDPATHTYLTGFHAVSRSLLLWRSFLQWLGGIGIIVLFLTLLPSLGVGGKLLYQMEVPGPLKESLAPRIRETATFLGKLYVGLSLLQISLLMWTNESISLFDAITTTFSTLSTGGFSIHESSFAAYPNLSTQIILIIFMILGSISFPFYFHFLKLKWYRIYLPNLFLFFLFLGMGGLLVSLPLLQLFPWDEAFRLGFFQAISSQTTTGYVVTNYDSWPFPSQMFLLLLMYVGGMTGSTAGGIKTNRFYILYKILSYHVETLFRPERVRLLKIGSQELDATTSSLALSFFFLAAFATVIGVVGYVLDGIDPETSLGLITCMLTNTGIAFRAASPMNGILFLPPLSKVLSLFWMLLGRLEFFSVLILFFPSFWKNR